MPLSQKANLKYGEKATKHKGNKLNTVQKEILDSIISIDKISALELNSQLRFSSDFIGFNGHFNKQPVLPAICLLEIIKCIVFKATDKKITITELISAKFYNVITVKEKIDILTSCEECFIEENNSGKEYILSAKFSGAASKKAILKLKVKID